MSGNDLGAEGSTLSGMSSTGERREVEASSCDCCRIVSRLVDCLRSDRGTAVCEKRLLSVDADGSDGGCADLLEVCDDTLVSWGSRV